MNSVQVNLKMQTVRLTNGRDVSEQSRTSSYAGLLNKHTDPITKASEEIQANFD